MKSSSSCSTTSTDYELLGITGEKIAIAFCKTATPDPHDRTRYVVRHPTRLPG